MSGLRALLGDPKRLTAMVNVGAPQPVSMQKLTGSMPGGGGLVEVADIGVLQARVGAAFNAGRLGQISRRDLREICAAYFYPPDPPGRLVDLSEALLNLVDRYRRRVTMFHLVNAYLDAFRSDDDDVDRLAKRLGGMVSSWPHRTGDTWPERARLFALFEPRVAPGRLCKVMLESNLTPYAVLQLAGLDTEHRYKGGLAEAAFRTACDLTRGEAVGRVEAHQIRLVDWARDSAGAFAYPSAWPAFVEACLAPWLNAEPDNAHKAKLIEILFEWGGGDPRMAKSTRWIAAQNREPEAFAVLMRWLTRASVLQFLDIVGQSIEGEAERRMWSYRRAFWTAYLMGVGGGPKIDEAWVAFGSDAARIARQTARRTGDRSFEAFGVQTERSDQHSALLIKIAGLTIVEWSHNSKCQFWARGDKAAPTLYRPKYFGQLYTAPHQEVHSSPATYSWQKKFAELIEGRRFYTEKPTWRPKRV